MEKMKRKRGRIEAHITTKNYEAILLEAEMEKLCIGFSMRKRRGF